MRETEIQSLTFLAALGLEHNEVVRSTARVCAQLTQEAENARLGPESKRSPTEASRGPVRGWFWQTLRR